VVARLLQDVPRPRLHKRLCTILFTNVWHILSRAVVVPLADVKFYFLSDVGYLQVGLPFFSFILLGWVGLQQGLKAKFKESERLKRYVEPEKPEDILAVGSWPHPSMQLLQIRG